MAIAQAQKNKVETAANISISRTKARRAQVNAQVIKVKYMMKISQSNKTINE